MLNNGIVTPIPEHAAIPPASSAETAGLKPSTAALLIWCAIAVLAAVGCLGIYQVLGSLWTLWTTDPLRSIGMLIPPASILLTLRVWRQSGWELRGTWWGLPVIALAFLLSMLHDSSLIEAFIGNARLSLVPASVPVFIYGSGIVLLFAGPRVGRKAWFPICLLLLSKPVPGIVGTLIDIPLQTVSAQVARSFATLIGFTPTTPQLRLMFSPKFGMFIAPGCDGIRGAVTMAYVALILGYLKRVSLVRWAAYVFGAAMLGYLFNFIRLCVLVVYYRLAFGHPALEGFAKWADYCIGSCLFLVAMFIFMRLANRRPGSPAEEDSLENRRPTPRFRAVAIKCVAFVLALAVVLSLPSSALRYRPQRSSTAIPSIGLMPRQVGSFALSRAWYEQQSGMTVEESAAYSAPGSDEVYLGVWVAKIFHDPNACWLARGQKADILTTRTFSVAQGPPIEMNIGFYSDGVTDSIVVSADCTSKSCLLFQRSSSNQQFGFLFVKPQLNQLSAVAEHPIPIMIRIDRLHAGTSKEANYDLLTAEAQKFLSGLNPMSMGGTFQ
jgi:exosortase J